MRGGGSGGSGTESAFGRALGACCLCSSCRPCCASGIFSSGGRTRSGNCSRRSGDRHGHALRLATQLVELEQWALANKKDTQNDTLAFWSLKAPAILTSAGTGVLAYFDQKTIGVVLGFVASVCVIIDGVQPRGMLRNIHLRAFHDIRFLSSKMVSQWRSREIDVREDVKSARSSGTPRKNDNVLPLTFGMRRTALNSRSKADSERKKRTLEKQGFHRPNNTP